MEESLVIIPSIGDIYFDNTNSVVDGVNKFCIDNKLKYKFKKSQEYKALDTLVKDGYLIIKYNGNDMVLVYLPVIVSDNQFKWLDENKNDLKKINTVGVFNYKNNQDKPDSLMSAIELMNEAKKKNKKYRK